MARMLEYCLHEKGVYVAQCAANLANNTELVALARVSAGYQTRFTQLTHMLLYCPGPRVMQSQPASMPCFCCGVAIRQCMVCVSSSTPCIS